MAENAHLDDWAEVEEAAEWTGLLVGNGASIAVWERFRYGSLFETAQQQIPDPLTVDDLALFDAFGTENFEFLLASLKTARTVVEALGGDAAGLIARYASIQHALFQAVHHVHVPWGRLTENQLEACRSALRAHRFVYSTNYDLLLYWAVTSDARGRGFLDFCWGVDDEGRPTGRFDPGATEVWPSKENWTRILFLHGGIQLRRLAGGGTRKALAGSATLLDQFGSREWTRETPLLVSEGDSQDKMRSILSSDYLAFAYEQFSRHAGGLVIFGHSLSDGDQHLVTPMSKWRDQPVAISLRRTDDDRIIEQKAAFRSRLAPFTDIVFFDAATHPLGGADVAVKPRGLFRRLR